MVKIHDEPTLEEELEAAEMMFDEVVETEANAPAIRMIEVEKIFPHPDNPRKDLGDVTELAESIKESGIMQNLTVVPGSYGYTAVIGHRRLAAAKLAGLKNVPCVVRAMSEKEQLAVMLSENMQRSDLTIVEQAGGIQMMLDLGETISDVSKQTGLSESTVRRRSNLMKVASVDKLKEAEMRGATLADYEKLLEIKDEAKREEVLESIGTKNFAWELKRAIDAQKDAEKIKVLKQYMDAQAKEISREEITADMDRVTSLYTWQSQADFSKPLGEDGEELFYWLTGNVFNIYRRLTAEQIEAKNKQDEDEQKERDRLQDKRNKLYELFELAKQQREDFLRGYRYKEEDLCYIAPIFIDDNNYYGTAWAETFKIAVSDADIDTSAKVIQKDGFAGVYKMLAIRAYVILKKKANSCFKYSTLEFIGDTGTKKMYEYLCNLGYELSDEEAALLDGSHDLYEKD